MNSRLDDKKTRDAIYEMNGIQDKSPQPATISTSLQRKLVLMNSMNQDISVINQVFEDSHQAVEES